MILGFGTRLTEGAPGYPQWRGRADPGRRWRDRRHEEFIGRVQARARLDSRGAAERATSAALATLAECIPAGPAESSPPSCRTRSPNAGEPRLPGRTITVFRPGTPRTRGTCPPPLNLSGVPDGATELVLLCEDLDAPPGRVVHWPVVGIEEAGFAPR
ncbi:DUF2267 domain-containing protein [Streptomyces sp. NPDC001816]|uniref:DUF2267 domain-containing protein n=1 Tax=Streptomyces sp. NPDC001816 TaxID=3364612 RepID=UPI0036C62ECA